MANEIPALDVIDEQLVRLLRKNARQSFRELAAVVHLSPAATTARIHALEAAGIIAGYHAVINPALAGRPTRAIVRLTSSQATTPSVDSAQKFAEHHPAVRTTFKVLGDCDLILDVEAVDLQELDSLVSDLGRYGVTNTTIVVTTTEKDLF